MTVIICSIIGAILLLILIFVGFWITTSNKFNKMKLKIDESYADIDAILTKRYEILTKQLNIIKGFSKDDRDTFVEVTAMRAAGTSRDIKTMTEANAQMDQLAKQINIQAEKYPELKANSMYSQLQTSIADVDERLQTSRRIFNSNVSRYNQAIIVFPGSIVAKVKHLTKAEFFKSEDKKSEDVEMYF